MIFSPSTLLMRMQVVLAKNQKPATTIRRVNATVNGAKPREDILAQMTNRSCKESGTSSHDKKCQCHCKRCETARGYLAQMTNYSCKESGTSRHDKKCQCHCKRCETAKRYPRTDKNCDSPDICNLPTRPLSPGIPASACAKGCRGGGR